jgi:SAM-dependent methyltransferase
MAKMKLLVFPLDLDDADIFIRCASALNIEIIGASSAMSGPGKKTVDHFIRLPFVTEPEFDGALKRAIEEYAITNVYAPHQGVWRHLDTLLRTHTAIYDFALCRPAPFTATLQLFALHEDWAASASSSCAPVRIGGVHPVRPPLPASYYSALHRQFLSIPGQCDEEKLLALCDITRLLPAGDMLEVGCLYGRSAFALGHLAQRHELGSLICVDPWNSGELADQGAQASVLNAEHVHIDFQGIFRIYLSAVALLDNVGYIRRTSAAALPVYQEALRQGVLHSPELGSIPLAGHLSLLHIDGNHRYDFVRKDVETWSPYLAPGGWLLLDDYVWAFGDGPRRVGDELLATPQYDSAFVSGDTLFLRRTEVV